MSDSDRLKAIAALEAARDRLEAILRAGFERPAAERSGLAPGSGGNHPESDVHESLLLVRQALDRLRSGATIAHIVEKAGASSDDLTSIRGIDPALAQHLASLGITSFAHIAAWRPDDVRNVSEALGLKREIGLQNWIEQAALLQRRKERGGVDALAPPAGQDPEPRATPDEALREQRGNDDHGDAPSALALDLAAQTLNVEAPPPSTAPMAKLLANHQDGRGGHRLAVEPSLAAGEAAVGIASEPTSPTHPPPAYTSAAMPAFAVSRRSTEEADVAIIKTGLPSGKAADVPTPRAGLVRRLLRGLTGG